LRGGGLFSLTTFPSSDLALIGLVPTPVPMGIVTLWAVLAANPTCNEQISKEHTAHGTLVKERFVNKSDEDRD
jgi:hypothetical protein